MGRYAQRRRASSGPSPAAPPAPPVTPQITLVTMTSGSSVDVTFSGPVTWNGFLFSANFTITGFGPTGGAQAAANVISLTGFGFVSGGGAWDMPGQPSWLDETVIFPASGTVS